MTKLEWIKSELFAGETANAATSRLNTPITVDNPEKQTSIPAPIDLVEIRSLVTDKEAFDVLESRTWDRIIDAIKIGDFAAIQSHVKALYAGNLISLATVNKLTTAMAKTIPDPNWQSSIQTTPAHAAGFDDVMVHEVQEAIDGI